MKDLTKRLITAIVGVIILIGVLLLGIKAVKVAVFIVTLEIIRELYNAFYKLEIRISLPILYLSSLITFLFSYFNYNIIFPLIITFLINGFFSIILIKYSTRDMVYTIFSYFYGVFFINLLAYVNEISFLISAFIIAFSTDTFAYIIGSKFGKHKLIERISPHKSVEGAIGGSIFSVIVTGFYFYFVKTHYINFDIDISVLIIILLASISGQFGDLFASKIKRETCIKDFSQILPGHGGFLDRFDSLIFVCPFVYFLYYFIS